MKSQEISLSIESQFTLDPWTVKSFGWIQRFWKGFPSL